MDSRVFMLVLMLFGNINAQSSNVTTIATSNVTTNPSSNVTTGVSANVTTNPTNSVTNQHYILTSEQKEELIIQHNIYRSSVFGTGPPASKMLKMEWDNHLAGQAETESKTCTYNNKREKDKDDTGSGSGSNSSLVSVEGAAISINKNLATYNQPVFSTIVKTVRQWGNGARQYDFNSDRCENSSCLSYLYMVQDIAEKFGCGITPCKNFVNGDQTSSGDYMVCYYYPAQRVDSSNPVQPFRVGQPCGDCPSDYKCIAFIGGKLCKKKDSSTLSHLEFEAVVGNSGNIENGFRALLAISFISYAYATKYFL